MSDSLTTPEGSSAGLLAGLRVVQVGELLGARWGATILADLGADVVQLVPLLDRPLSDVRSTWSDRNVRVVELDRAAPGGAQLLERLVSWSDIVVATADHDGEDVLRLAGEADRLVCAVATGLDNVPADAAELILQARTGCMDITGDPDGPPVTFGAPLAGLTTGVYVAAAVLAELAGEGGSTSARARIDVSTLDSTVSLLSYMAVSYFATGAATSRLGTGHPTIYPYNAFAAADGELVVAAFTQRFWRQFCAALERPDLPEDERFADFAARLKHKRELTEILDSIMVTRTVDDWIRRIEAADVPCGAVATVAQAIEHAQTAHRGSTPVAAGTQLRTIGSPFRFEFWDGSTYRPPARAPRGGDVRDVLAASTHRTRLTAVPEENR